jgi:hypothetical protein
MPPVTENILNGFYAVGGFFFISSLTWLFSSRRKLFIRAFVPADELRQAVRDMRDDDEFRRGMRSIAYLQFGTTFVILLFVLGFWVV